MENIGYLFAVFTVIWITIFAYVLILIRRQRQLKKEIQILKDRLEQ